MMIEGQESQSLSFELVFSQNWLIYLRLNSFYQRLKDTPATPECDPAWQAVTFTIEMATKATDGKRDICYRRDRFVDSRAQNL